MLWEWLTTAQSDATPAQNASLTKTKQSKHSKAQLELDSYVGESGMLGFIRAYRNHENEVIETLTSSLIQYGRDNYVELFTYQLNAHSQDEQEYLRILQDTLPFLVSTSKGRLAFIDTGVINMIIDMCLSICESIGSSNDSRQVAMALLVMIWKTKPEVV
jgi:hypothetical protein